MNKILLKKQNDTIKHISDDYAIKNFVLVDSSEIPKGQPLEQALIFNGFVFGVCLKGNAQFKINYRTYEISENEIFTILPDQIFKLIRESNDLLIETLFLSADFIIRLPLPKNFDLLKKIDSSPTQKVKKDAIHDILEIHSLIAKHHHNELNPYRDLMTSGFIYALLMQIGYLYEASPVIQSPFLSRQEALTEEFFRLLIEHYIHERSVAFYAEKLSLTPKYLSMAIKKVTGHSILNWINEAVIIEAKKRLKTTDHTILQISEELNFPNPSFFGRFFKQYVGMTPLEYRNN